MQISHAITNLEQQVAAQMRFAGADQASQIGEILGLITPAVRQTLLEVVEAAVTEINSQLPGHQVDIRLVDGDPELTVTRAQAPAPPPPPDYPGHEEFDEARITLRIPGYLKDIISEAAKHAGDSVNSYVVDSLRSTARGAGPKKTVNEKIIL